MNLLNIRTDLIAGYEAKIRCRKRKATIDKIRTKIPINLVECVNCFICNFNAINLERFRCQSEQDIFSIADHRDNISRWIRNEWNLWNEKSSLRKSFMLIGIWHPDDISEIILKTTHRILNQRPVELKKQIERHKKYWKRTAIVNRWVTANYFNSKEKHEKLELEFTE